MEFIQNHPSDAEVQGTTVGVVERRLVTWTVENDRVKVAVNRNEGLTFEMFHVPLSTVIFPNPARLTKLGLQVHFKHGTFRRVRGTFTRNAPCLNGTLHIVLDIDMPSSQRVLLICRVGIMKENRFEVWWASGCQPGATVMVQKENRLRSRHSVCRGTGIPKWQALLLILSTAH
jgi:hypothetical protein